MAERRYLYPLTFDPLFKEKTWGGTKIRHVLGKDFSPLKNCGEAWEISGIPGNLSKVSRGVLKGMTIPEITARFKEAFVGKKVYEKYGNEFPLLVKFIDAAEDLSIQVHPGDALAEERHKALGKTEMWYVVQADAGARLLAGFNREMSKAEYLECLKKGMLDRILNVEQVKAGDAFFIPAGSVHSIGKGILLAEIQQASDITYRIYDFDRTDEKGEKRELHTGQSLEALDYRFYPRYRIDHKKEANAVVPLVRSEYFQTNLLAFDTGVTREYYGKDSFVIYTCIKGETEIRTEGYTTKMCMGNAVLLPQKFLKVDFFTNSSFKILETYVP